MAGIYLPLHSSLNQVDSFPKSISPRSAQILNEVKKALDLIPHLNLGDKVRDWIL